MVFLTRKLYGIEKSLTDISIEKEKIERDIDSVGSFLRKFGYDSEDELKKEIIAQSENDKKQIRKR